jgi:hypothetical protein
MRAVINELPPHRLDSVAAARCCPCRGARRRAADVDPPLRRRTRRHPHSQRVPTPIGLSGVSPLRRFPRATLTQPPQQTGHRPAYDAAELLVITTPDDDPLDRLRAGEATSAVLLAATGLGLACTPLSQALEVDTGRQAVQIDVLHVPEQPQLILRIGSPADGSADLPPTPRRALHSVLLPNS